jgi:hypothetical protein
VEHVLESATGIQEAIKEACESVEILTEEYGAPIHAPLPADSASQCSDAQSLNSNNSKKG